MSSDVEALLAEEAAAAGRQATGYMKPPQEIIDLVDIPPEPNLSFSPDRTKVLQLYKPSPLPPISELARPELKLAGKFPSPSQAIFVCLACDRPLHQATIKRPY